MLNIAWQIPAAYSGGTLLFLQPGDLAWLSFFVVFLLFSHVTTSSLWKFNLTTACTERRSSATLEGSFVCMSSLYWIYSDINGVLRVLRYPVQAHVSLLSWNQTWARNVTGWRNIHVLSLICLSTFYAAHTSYIRNRFIADSEGPVFFAWKIFYPYLVIVITIDHNFLLFSPYLNNVTWMSCPLFQCLSAAIWWCCSNPYILLVSMETKYAISLTNQTLLQTWKPKCDSALNHKPKYCYTLRQDTVTFLLYPS